MKSNYKKLAFLFILSFVFLVFTNLVYYGNIFDCYWNYNNSLQIANGLVPYKEINIITTPLFHFILSFFLFIFGKSIIVYACLMSIIKIFHMYILTKILGLLTKKKDFNYLFFSMGIILLFFTYYEYNLLALLFLSLIIYIELQSKKNIKYQILIGVLAALSLLSKQSIGVFVILFVLIKPFIFKDNLKNIIYRLIGFFFPCAILLIYLLLTNSLNSFIDYTILGLKEFNNYISILDTIRIKITNENGISLSLILFITYLFSIIILIIYLIEELLKKKLDKKIMIFSFYGLLSLSCFYPIHDYHHIIPIIITLFPLIYYLIKSDKYNLFKYKRIRISAIIIGMFISLIPFYQYIKIYNGYGNKFVVLKDDYNSLNGIVVTESLRDTLDTVIAFEKEYKDKDVIILNMSAVIYHLAQNKYYKDYDLFMRGNFGENGEDKLIEDIKTHDNRIYLAKQSDLENKEVNYDQVPNKVLDYVINNLNEEGKFLSYEIYSK